MSKNPVVSYYHSLESRFGYRLLKGVKHFGYYPEGQETLAMHEAQLAMNEQLASRLAVKPGGLVLDAGCGEGNVALYLAERHSVKVTGIDLLDFNVANAKRQAEKRNLTDKVSFQVGTYMELPFGNDTFDAVYTMETLVHAPDYKKALSEFYRVLKPGGSLVLFEYSIKPDAEVTPAERQGMERIRYINRVASMPAFNEFTFGSMELKVSEAGFSGVTSEDITARIMPMLKRFHAKAKNIYKIFRILHAQKYLINGMSAVEFYENQGLWRYVIVRAVK